MTPATVRTVRTACVQHSRLTSMPAPLKESFSPDGGVKCAVSKNHQLSHQIFHLEMTPCPDCNNVLFTVKYATSCPNTMVYTYDVWRSMQSCRCHSDPDFTCGVTFDPVDGCVCAEGMYLNENGQCVSLDKCSCYHKGSVIPPGEVISKDGGMWYVWLAFIMSECQQKGDFKIINM